MFIKEQSNINSKMKKRKNKIQLSRSKKVRIIIKSSPPKWSLMGNVKKINKNQKKN